MKLSKKFKSKIKSSIMMTMCVLSIVFCCVVADRFINTAKYEFISYMQKKEADVLASDNAAAKNTPVADLYIYTVQDLCDFRDSVNSGNSYEGKTVVLMNDIDLSSVCGSSIGSWVAIGNSSGAYFAGTFDGNYHKIDNLYYNSNDYVYAGLFSRLEENGVLKNIIFENVYVNNECTSGRLYTGALVGYSYGIIENIGVYSGEIHGGNTSIYNSCASGGVAGSLAKNARASNCANKANVTTSIVASSSYDAYSGGIVGMINEVNNVVIENCYNTGSMMTYGGGRRSGGILGYGYKVSGYTTTVKNSYNIGTISAGSGSAGSAYVAGIIGLDGWSSTYTHGTLSNSYCLDAYTERLYNGSPIGYGTTGASINSDVLKTYSKKLGNAWSHDAWNLNNGYPILEWEAPNITLNVRNEYIKINQNLEIKVEKNQIFENIYGNSYDNSKFEWSSSNEDIATVSDSGIVTGKGVGHATITCNGPDGLKAKVIVNVYRNKDGAITTPDIQHGEGFTIVLKEDGTVWAYGQNNYGQLGQGDTTNRKKPVQVKVDENTYLENIKKISVGFNHILALSTDGKVYSWGKNHAGTLGNNNDSSYKTYATNMNGINGTGYLENIIDIAISHDISYAIDVDGNLIGCGSGDYNAFLGSSGSGIVYNPIRVAAISDAIMISTGTNNMAIIEQDSDVYVWGNNGSGALGIGSSARDAVDTYISNDIDWIDFGGYSSYYLKEDGTLYSAGMNNYGQLGLGSTSNVSSFTQVKYEDGSEVKAKQIFAGGRNLIFTALDGKTYITGYNGYGQLSNGSTGNAIYPTVMRNIDNSELTDTIMLSTGDCIYDSVSRNSGVIRSDGTVWVSGDNSYGQIGNDTTVSSKYLIQSGETIVKLNARNEYIKIGDTFDIDVLEADEFNVFIQDINQSDWTWTSSNEDIATVNAEGKVKGLSVGHTTITGYGPNGLKAKVVINVYRNKTGAITVPQVEMGEGFAIILKEDGTVWSSGLNNYGQLGNGTTTNSNTPVRVKIDESTYLTGIRKIGVGQHSTVALKEDGTVWSWGGNSYGQLGNNTSQNSVYATQVVGAGESEYLENIADISIGFVETGAVTRSGDVYIWGRGTCGVIGNGTKSNISKPQKANIENVIKISLKEHALALKATGEVYGWGGDGIGENYLVLSSNATVPNKMTEDAIDIIAIEKDSIILKEDGNIYGCGINQYGELQTGNTSAVSTLIKISNLPQTVLEGNAKIKYISGGQGNIQLILSDGTAWMNGCNSEGTLGNGTTTNSIEFVQMRDESGAINDAFQPGKETSWLSNGTYGFNSQIIRQDGTVWVSGNNTYGQIGNACNTSNKYLTKLGINEVVLNSRNEYIRIGESINICVEQASGFNVFIQDEPNQTDWTWKSSNEDVALVDSNGIVIGKGLGHTTIIGSNEKLNITAISIVNVYRNQKNAITVPDIETTAKFTAVLKEDGSVWMVGDNTYGQLGNGSNNANLEFVRVKKADNTYLDNIIQIAVSEYSVLALSKDGTLYSWGANTYGQLGINSTVSSNVAVQVLNETGDEPLKDIKYVEINNDDDTNQICVGAINSKGELYVWGDTAATIYNTLNDWNNPKTLLPTKVVAKNAVKVEFGNHNMYVLNSDQTVYSIGYNQHGQLGKNYANTKDLNFNLMLNETASAPINNIIDISASTGFTHVVALNSNKEVLTCGYNGYYELVDGSTNSGYVLKKCNIGAIQVKAIESGYYTTMILSNDGKVYGLGLNTKGQLAQNNTTNLTNLTVLKDSNEGRELDNVLLMGHMKSTSTTSSVIKEDGTVWVSGDNTYNQMGISNVTSVSHMVKAGKNIVELNVQNEYIKVGENIDIDILESSEFNVFIQDIQNQSDWTWESSNEDVASINKDGIVTGIGVGRTTITAYNTKTGIKGKTIINVYRNKDGAITVPQVEMGEGFAIILKEDGTVWSSGLNNYGQLGNGTTTNSNTPVRVKIDESTYLTGIRKIGVGQHSTVALKEDGTVWSWGGNSYGQLGNNTSQNSVYATQVVGAGESEYLENIADISIGFVETGAVTRSGDVYIWGRGTCGVIGNGTKSNISKPQKANIENVIKISLKEHALALKATGEVYGWGGDGIGENYLVLSSNATVPNKMTEDAIDIIAIEKDSIILKEDGNIYGCGINQYGELQTGNTSAVSTLIKISNLPQTVLEGNAKIKYISGGQGNIQLILSDGTAWMNGCNSEGTLGNGTTTNSIEFVQMRDESGAINDAFQPGKETSWLSNGTYGFNSQIIRQDGTVWVAGNNTYGQIGNATNTSVNYVTKMGDGFLNYPEKVYEIGINESKNLNANLFTVEEDMNVFTDASTKLGNISYTVEDDTIADVAQNGVITGKTQGNTKIKVSDSITGARTNIWVKVVNDKNIKITLGNRFTIALKQDGTVWSWGENHVGQLGLGNTTYFNEPQKIEGITEKIVDVKSGYYHCIALTENGEVYTWGYNYYGQLGNGKTETSINPIKLDKLGKVIKIDAYKYMTIILNDAGEVYVWGNGYGSNPVKLNFSRKVIDIAGNIILEENRRAYNLNESNSYGRDIIKISAGENHYLALDANGEVYAWGTNNYGQLGNGNNTSSNIPTKVVTPDGTENISDIVEISAGDHYSIISDKEGNIYTFGYNGHYRTANENTVNKPVQITDNVSKIELVSASEGGHTVISDWDGYVYTVGLNDAGQLGLGDNSNRSKFEMVGKLQIISNPEKISLHVGETKNVDLSVGSSFNLKSDVAQLSGTINKVIANTNIASVSEDVVTGESIGRTILNATYTGTIGTISQNERSFYRNIEVEVLPEGGVAVPNVDSGNGFTVSLKSDGSVWSWGTNNYGQLGLGNTIAYNEPQKIELTDIIKDVAVGTNHALALTESGKVYAWGLGNYGQLGQGNGYNQLSPVVVYNTEGKILEDIVKIEAGDEVSFAINSKGEVYAWGKNYSSRAQRLNTKENVIDVTSKYILTGDGEVWDIAGENKLVIVGKISEIDEGTDHTVLLAENGLAYAVGDNTYGQLGNGNNVSSIDAAVAIRKNESDLFTGIKQIKAGDKTTVIVSNEGKVYACGMNDCYELGTDDKDILDINIPRQIENFDDNILVAIGTNHVTAVKSNGTVYDWGNGINGELGNRKNKASVEPVVVGDFIVRTTKNHVSMKVGQTETIEGRVEYFNLFTNDIKEINYSSKDSSVADVITNVNSDGIYEAQITANAIGTTTLIASQTGSSNIGVIQVEVLQEEAGQTGIVIEPNVVTTGSHTVSLRADGKVFTWGSNAFGQLGNGTTNDSDEPVEVNFKEGTIITQVAAGEEYSVALDSEGNVWTWGRNNYFQIGHTGGDQYTPYKVGGLPKAIKIAAGNYTTMVITENKELYGWGFNGYGNIGIGSYTNKVTASKVVGFEDVIDVSVGKNHTMTLTSDGNVYVTGSNLYGQLGNGNEEIFKVNEFTKVNLPDVITTIDCGELSNAVITVNGNVYTWGQNAYGQLGLGDKETQFNPTLVSGLNNIREIEIGKTNAIVRDGNGKMYITGSNIYGQLGKGTKGSSTNVTNFEMLTKIDNGLRLATGDTYVVVLKEDGFVWAWGDYNHGDMEKKSITNSKVPVLVGSDSTSLDSLEVVLQKSETKNIMANAKFKFNLIYIEDNDMSNFEFTSYNSDIAEVDSDGDILGKREGTTWVKATDTNTGKSNIAIVRVISNSADYEAHVAPKVVAGEDFGVGLKEDGTVWIWGYDDSGLAYSNIPASTNVLATYEDIDSGKNFSMALRTDGTVWTVGDNTHGQLGQGDNINRVKYVQIEGLRDIVQIAAGDTHAIAVDRFGIVYGWGSNSKGELGKENIGANTLRPVTISIPNDKVTQIAGGKNETVIVANSGKVYGIGEFLNGYVKDQDGFDIEDAVKAVVGDNYILVLRQNGTIWKYQYGYTTRVGTVTNAIDVSAKGKVNMYQSVDEKTYTWGDNSNGQLGLDLINIAVANPILAHENSTNTFRTGAGYNNSFIIANTGFVYGAGRNINGELGNGTSTDSTSPTFAQSSIHTLVGDRKFEVLPESRILEINEIEELSIKANGFNVFGEINPEVVEYTWSSDDSNVVSVLNPGEIQAVNEGTTKIKITDTIINQAVEIERIVVPVDTDRIKTITANGIEAGASAAYTYEAKIPLDDTETTANVVITTKLGTDKISIDDGITWTTGSVDTIVDIPGKTAELAFIVQTEAGNKLNYTLNIVRQSNKNTISNNGVTVKKAGTSTFIPAEKNANNPDLYEIVIPNTGANVVKVDAEDNNALVSINGMIGTLATQNYNFVMPAGMKVKDIPIKITSESGREKEYILRAYTADYVTTLKSVYVNQIEAVVNSNGDYEIIIDDLVNISEVKAIANIATSKVGINGSTKETNQIIKNITTIGDVTTVTIEVESNDGSLNESHNLIIKKKRANSRIQTLTVDGVVIQEVNGVYEANVATEATSAEVKIVAKDTIYYITLGDFDEENYTITKTVDINSDDVKYSIAVRNEDDESVENYVLVLHKLSSGTGEIDPPGSQEVGIKYLYATNSGVNRYAIQDNTDKTKFKIKVPDSYTSTYLTVIGTNKTSKISIDTQAEETGMSIREISLNDKETVVPVHIETEDGILDADYEVVIVRCSEDTSLIIELDEYPNDDSNSLLTATLIDTDTYFIQLQNPVNVVDIIATTTDENAYVKIMPNSYQMNVDKLNKYKITEYETELRIIVTSECGTEKEYRLIIRTLEDNVNLATVEVNGDTAVYNAVSGKYEIRRAKTENSYTITATASDSSAKVSINGNAETIHTSIKTEVKAGAVHNSIICVKSANGLNEKEYQLEITEKSDNAEIGTIKVNGQIIVPEADGNYVINVNHTTESLEIYGQAAEEHAQISIDGETIYQNNVTITRTMSGTQEIYNITVVSEDGTVINTKTLTVNRLSGNTNISEITIDTPDSETYNLSGGKIIAKDDGTYYCKIKRNSQAEISVSLDDSNAKVSILGGSDTEIVTLLNDITDINIVVTAEDGTPRTTILRIEKESDDTKLKNLVIVNTSGNNNLVAPVVSDVDSSTFEVKVDDRATELDVSAITDHLLAAVKLGTETDNDYVMSEMLNKTVDITGVDSFTIDVKPECGTPIKTYTIEITRIYNKDIKKVVTDGDEATLDGIVYSGWIDANDNIANIEITADNQLTEIELYSEGNLVASGTGVLNYQDISVVGNSKQYKIKAINPSNSSDSKEYILKVAKKSTNNDIEFVKLNGVNLAEQNGIYKATVGSASQYIIKVGAKDEYAQISFENGNYINSNEAEFEIENLQPGQTKQIKFKVKSQNGEETEEKIIEVYRQDNNVNITSVKVNGTDITATYNSGTKAYNIVLDNSISQTDIQVDVESILATIGIDVDGLTYSQTGSLTVSNVQLPGVGRKEVIFTVTAEDGIQETRKIIISQFSSDVELESVKVNGKEATKRDDNDYEIVIGDLNPDATIYAKALTDTTKVSINNQTENIASSTSIMPNILVAGTSFNLPIKAIAEDGTEYEYTLYVTVKSGNNSLEYIKVDSKTVTEEISPNVYRIFVENSASSVPVAIKAVGDLATVSTEINGTEIAGNPLMFNKVLEDERTSIKFKITSEAGSEKEYELQIFKVSNDNTLGELYVNGNLLEKNLDTGRYYYSINDGDLNPRVKAIANNEFAYVRIALFAEDTNISEHIVNMSNSKITTIPITIRSQTGVSNVEYLDIETIYATSTVESMIVDDIEVTSYNGETKTYTAYVDPDTNPHEIFIMASNMYAKIELNETIDDGNITTYVSMADDEYEKNIPLKITSETNIVSEYTLKLVKLSDNVNVQAIIVNDVSLTPDEDNPTIYKKSIKKLANKAKIKVITEYPYATVKIADEEIKTNTAEVWVDLSLLEDIITIPVVVKATDGETIETYNIVLIRLSNDCQAEVSYDGVVLTKADDGKYHVNVLETATSGLIEVTANDANAKIDINNTGVLDIGSKTYTLNIDTEKSGRSIEVPISVIAEDDTVENTSIVITRISTNANTAKVEGTYEVADGDTIKPVTEEAQIDEGIYVLGVKEETNEVKLKITLENENANITRGSDVGVGSLETIVTLKDRITYVNYTVVAEDGVTTKTETIKIVKQSSNASIAKLVVDGNEIILGDDGKYHASVKGGTSEVQVKITAASDQATIKLGDNSSKAYLDTKVTLDNIQNTYTIKVTAEDGTVKEYVLHITKQTNIAGKILTEHFEGKHKSTVYVFKTSDKKDEDLENYLLPDNSVNPNVRQVIDKVETEDDGSFIVKLQAVDKYDILVVKQGYLNYRVTDIEVTKGEKIDLDEYSLIAGDIIKTDEIEIDDLVTLNDSFGVTITDANKSTNGICDLNEDGIVNSLDRNILKTNYGKTAETVKWTNPNAMALMMSIDEGIQAQSIESVDEQGETDLKKDYILPMTCDYVISSNYGNRVHPVTGETKLHSGIDIVGTHHTQILSVADGEVTYAGVQSGYGNCVEIKHAVNGVTVYSFYAHLSQIDVSLGDIVSQGDVIGLEGGAESDPNHGTSTGHHLHFEIRSASGSGNSLDPNEYIKFSK